MQRTGGVVRTICTALLLLSMSAFGQQSLPEGPKPQPDAAQTDAQNLPDAPSQGKLPVPPVSPANAGQTPPGAANSVDAPAPEPTAPPVKPSSNVRTVAPSQVRNTPGSGYDETQGLIRVNVNAVPVPVTVKDQNGRLVPGLTVDNFSVYEDGVKQPIRFFTSDPFPISAAIVVDVGMPEVALRKVKETFSALAGAFSQYDEVSVYTYGNTVKQQQDYLAALGDTTTRTLSRVEGIQGRNAGPTVYEPMTVGPTVNGRVFDPGQQRAQVEYGATREVEPSRVLNDAVLRAAFDLGKREKARRKILFVISDGREKGSKASYGDVLKVLLSNNVALYGIAIDTSALPVVGRLNKIHIPRQGYGNILPKYASATGGEIFTEFTSEAMELAYAAATEEARSQYTIVYNAPNTVSTSYRNIEVRVSGYGNKLKIYSRAGYYPTLMK